MDSKYTSVNLAQVLNVHCIRNGKELGMSPRFRAIEIMKIPFIVKKKTARDFFDNEKIGDFAFGYVEFEILVISQISVVLTIHWLVAFLAHVFFIKKSR